MPSFLPESLLLPQRVIAKRGAILELGAAARPFGAKGFIVHGRSLQASGQLAAILRALPPGMTAGVWQQAGGEPTTAEVDRLRAALAADRPAWVAAIGGGSVLDLAKAAAGLLDAPEPAAYYQQNPATIPVAALPLLAAPTTAGTGSEATVVAVLTDTAHGLKRSIRHPSYMPKTVILDPALLASCPAQTIACSGLDAFIQAYESFTSRHATPFTRSLAEAALVQIAKSLLPFYRGDLSESAPMLQASFTAGIALSHSRLGVIHGLAHPLGARFHAAHGLACACCLPACLAFNHETIAKDLALIRERHGIDIEATIHEWLDAMKLASPFAGGRLADRDAVIQEVLASGSTAANPRPVTARDVLDLLDAILAGA